MSKYSYRDRWTLIRQILRLIDNEQGALVPRSRISFLIGTSGYHAQYILDEMVGSGIIKMRLKGKDSTDYYRGRHAKYFVTITTKGINVLELMEKQAKLIVKAPWVPAEKTTALALPQ